MHTLTIHAKFTFGDRVKFVSPTQGCSGTGRIHAVTVGHDGGELFLEYQIEVDTTERDLSRSFDIQPGILENEIDLLREHTKF